MAVARGCRRCGHGWLQLACWAGWIATSVPAQLLGFRWIFLNASTFVFPFFWMACTAALSFVIGWVFFIANLCRGRDGMRRHTLLAFDYIVLSVLNAAFYLLAVYAIVQSGNTVGIVLNLMLTMMLWQPILSAIILRRRPALGQLLAIVFVLGAVAVYVLLQWSPSAYTTVTVDLPTVDETIAWVYAWAAAFAYALRGVLARYLTLRRCHFAKQRQLAVKNAKASPELLEVHLFAGDDDVHLTKLDHVYDLPLYDMEYIGIDVHSTMELEFLGGSLALLPIALVASAIAGESAVWSSLTTYSWEAWVTLACATFAYMINPLFRSRTVTGSSDLEYVTVWTVSFAVVMVVAAFLLSETFTTLQVIAIFVLYLAMLVFRSALVAQQRERTAQVHLALVKEKLHGLSADVENHLLHVKDALGFDAFERVLFENAVSDGTTGLASTSCSALSLRGLFDVKYRTANGRVSFNAKRAEREGMRGIVASSRSLPVYDHTDVVAVTVSRNRVDAASASGGAGDGAAATGAMTAAGSPVGPGNTGAESQALLADSIRVAPQTSSARGSVSMPGSPVGIVPGGNVGVPRVVSGSHQQLVSSDAAATPGRVESPSGSPHLSSGASGAGAAPRVSLPSSASTAAAGRVPPLRTMPSQGAAGTGLPRAPPLPHPQSMQRGSVVSIGAPASSREDYQREVLASAAFVDPAGDQGDAVDFASMNEADREK